MGAEVQLSRRAPDLGKLGRPGGCPPPPPTEAPVTTAWESGQLAGPRAARRRPFLLPAGAWAERPVPRGGIAGEHRPHHPGWGGSRLDTPLAPAEFGRACSVGAEAPRSCQQLRGRRAGSFFLGRAGSFWAAPDGGWRAAAAAARGWGQPRRPWSGKSGTEEGQLEMGAKAGAGGGDSLAWRVPEGK